MLDKVALYEVPLQRALKREYFSGRGWNVCGPAGIVLAWLLHEDTGIPLCESSDRRLEHLQLRIHYMDGNNDQTNLQYHLGNGFVITIDPLLLTFRHHREPGSGTTLVEWHYDGLLTSDLGFYGLHPLGKHRYTNDIYPNDDHVPYAGLRRAMHDGSAFDNHIEMVGGSHDVSAYWGDRLRRVYTEVRQEASTSGPLLHEFAQAAAHLAINA